MTPNRVPPKIKTKPARRVKELSSLRSVLFILATPLLSCSVAQVQYSAIKVPPTRYYYIGYHTIPRAYGGGVCAHRARHSHVYPPVPQSAFKESETGFSDMRDFDVYIDPHKHSPQTCFRKGWHLHLRPEK